MLKKEKSALVKSFELNVFKEVDAALQGGDDDSNSLTGLVQMINDTLVELTDYNKKIYDLLSASDEDADTTALDAEIDSDMKLKLKAKKCKARLESAIKGKNPAPVVTVKPPEEESPTISTISQKRRPKVPDIKIPTFDGSYLE